MHLFRCICLPGSGDQTCFSSEFCPYSPTPKAKACYGLRFAPCCSPAQYTTLVGSPQLPVSGSHPPTLHSPSHLVPATGRYRSVLSFSYSCVYMCVCVCLNTKLHFLFSPSHSWVLHPTPSPTPTLSPSLKKMSVSLTTDIQLEGESGPLTEPCSRGKISPQPQGTKEGTGEGLEPEESSPQDAQVGRSGSISMLIG